MDPRRPNHRTRRNLKREDARNSRDYPSEPTERKRQRWLQTVNRYNQWERMYEHKWRTLDAR